MSDETSAVSSVQPAPDDRPPRVAGREQLVEVAEGVWILPDVERTPHVPNIGIVLGERSALVVESGMGVENGRRVLEMARELAGERHLFLTASHFHPEHGLGAQPFVGEATILMNEAQRDELFEKGPGFVELFRTFSPAIAEALEGIELVQPDLVYRERATLDLGGRVVELTERGMGHTRGDQWIVLPVERVVFAGDLVEERFHAIMPDEDADGEIWLRRLRELEALEPDVVVPGHGSHAGVEISEAARVALEEIRHLALSLRAEGRDDEQVASAVEAEIIARYPDWDNREWVATSARDFLAD